MAKTQSAKAPQQLSPDASVAASKAAARVLNAPRFLRFPVFSSFYRE
jgi:hypothetical protein